MPRSRGKKNKCYSSEFKENAVKLYLSNNYSLNEVCRMLEISSHDSLIRWVKRYFDNKSQKEYTGNSKFKGSRSCLDLSKEEKLGIIDYCKKHENDYMGTAVKYDISYYSVYRLCNPR